MKINNKIRRTHTCGELRLKDLGKEVVLCGWVESVRLHGGMGFINLFDRYGTTQIVFDKKDLGKEFDSIKDISQHSTMCVIGTVRERPKGSRNPKMKTGDIEILVKKFIICNISKPLPIPLANDIQIYDDIKLKWRPIYLRKKEIQEKIILRSRIINTIMRYLYENDFIYIETPILAKPTPEGARDFLVPSRLHPGKFYALPQSPQQYKQKLMIAGFDKYYQIARCLRDEDLRADRQPEFTQVDIEMSWVEAKDIFKIIEGLLKCVFKEVGIKIKTPFPRISYDKAIDLYGTDKPDIRFSLDIIDISKIFEKTAFSIFRNVLENKGVINLIKVPNSSDKFTRKYINILLKYVRQIGGKGIIILKVQKNNKIESAISKYLSEREIKNLVKITEAQENDTLLIAAGKKLEVKKILGAVRLKVANDFDLITKNQYQPLWITDFPMFEFSDKEHRWVCVHHPFTLPKDEYIDILMNIDSFEDLENISPADIKSKAYDLVINGWEVGSGSIRIHKRKLQEKIFKLLGMSEDEYMSKFGSLLEFLDYGAPIHGGIALGLDRLVAILAGVDSIREVIAFPKNRDAKCLMDESPSDVSDEQLKELNISITGGGSYE